MERTIKVIGKGSLVLQPDLMKITIHLNDSKEDYDQTLLASSTMKDEITNALVTIGLKREDLKTTSFHINTKYVGYNDEQGNWKNQFVGYEFFHDLILTIKDFSLLGKILGAIANCDCKPEFSIQYTFEDTDSIKDELLTLAFKDAKKHAEILSKASLVKLKEIQSIDYSYINIDFAIKPVERVSLAKNTMDSINLDIHPDHIIVEDHVSIIWSIE